MLKTIENYGIQTILWAGVAVFAAMVMLPFYAKADSSCGINESRMNPTELSAYQECWLDTHRADETHGILGSLFWVKVNDTFYSTQIRNLMTNGQREAWLSAITDEQIEIAQTGFEQSRAVEISATEVLNAKIALELAETREELKQAAMDLAAAQAKLTTVIADIENQEAILAALQSDLDSFKVSVLSFDEDPTEALSDNNPLEHQALIDLLNAQNAKMVIFSEEGHEMKFVKVDGTWEEVGQSLKVAGNISSKVSIQTRTHIEGGDRVMLGDVEGYRVQNLYSTVNVEGEKRKYHINGNNMGLWGTADTIADLANEIGKMVNDAYDAGYSDGYADGYSAGYADGFADGVTSVQ